MTPLNDDAESARDARVRRFVDEYLIDHNGVRAYLESFGRETAAGRPRSYNAACVEASKLLKNAEVREEIRAAERAIRRRCHVTADKVINELAAIAFASMGDVLDFTGQGLPQPKPAREIPFQSQKSIQSLRHRRRELPDAIEELVEYRLYPKVPALAKLYDHLGLGGENALEAILSVLPEELRHQVMNALDTASKRSRDTPDLVDADIILLRDPENISEGSSSEG